MTTAGSWWLREQIPALPLVMNTVAKLVEIASKP
jgi:hypothetical protein